MSVDWNAFGMTPMVWVISGVMLYLTALAMSRSLLRLRRMPAWVFAGIVVSAGLVMSVVAVFAWPFATVTTAIATGYQAYLSHGWSDIAFVALWAGAGLTLGPWLVALVLPKSVMARRARPGLAMGSFAIGLILFVLFESSIRQTVHHFASGGGKLGLVGSFTLELTPVADRSARAAFTLRPGEADQTGGALATAAHELSRMTQHGMGPAKDNFSHLSLIERDFRILATSQVMSRLEKHLRERARGDLRLLIGLTPAFACLHAFASENGDRALLSPALAPFLNALVALVESGAAAGPPFRARWVGRAAPGVRDLAWAGTPEPMAGEQTRMSNARRLLDLQRAGVALVNQLGLLTRASARQNEDADHDGQSGCSHPVSLIEVKEEDLPFLNVTPYPAIAAAELFAAIGSAEQGVAILDRWIARRESATAPSPELVWWPIRARIERAILMDRSANQAFSSEQRSFLLHELTQHITRRFVRSGADGRPEKDASDVLCKVIRANLQSAHRSARQWIAFTHATFRSRAFSLVVPQDDLAELGAWLAQAEEIVRDAQAGCFVGLQRYDQSPEGWLALFELDRLWLRAISLFQPDARVADAAERSRRVVTLLADARAIEQRLAGVVRLDITRAAGQTVNWCAHLDRAIGLAAAIQTMVADPAAQAPSGPGGARATRQQCLQRRPQVIHAHRAD